MHRIDRPISVAMVGIGGYGYYYLKHLLKEHSPRDIALVALVDPNYSRSMIAPELKDLQVPVFSSLPEFYAEHGTADLVIISSPMHFHTEQIILAVQNGANVLCEKPLAVTVQEADRIIRNKNRSGKKCLVGYQWSYSRAIQSVKLDIGKGLLGRPIRFKALCFWPRDRAYYLRNDWAGKIKDNTGKWVLDSPAGNAMSHFLHNLFYLLGKEVDASAAPAHLAAELYRIYPIENYDSAACRICTTEGTELLFYASHTTPCDLGPMFSLEFENAQVDFGEKSSVITALGHSGRQKQYGSPEDDPQFKKITAALKAVKESGMVVCGPESSRSQILAVNGMQESMPEPLDLPAKYIKHDQNRDSSWSSELAEVFFDCYQQGKLPSEIQTDWAQKGKNVALEKYDFFPDGGENSS